MGSLVGTDAPLDGETGQATTQGMGCSQKSSR
jgi:hypothetical protein